MNPNNLALLLGLSVIAALGLRFVNKRPPPNPEPEPEITVQSAGATVPAVVRPPARPPARPLARPRIPAPAMVPLTNQTEAVTAPTGGWLEKLLDGSGGPELNPAQVAAYLEENRRTAESLITAAALTGNVDCLREAATHAPGDPRVHLRLAFAGATPEERAAAVAALRAADPDNALGDYLAAHADFKSGHTDAAVTNLLLAAGKGPLRDYTLDFAQAAEEAYLSAGYSVAEAKVAGMIGIVLPHFQQLRDVGREMSSLQQEYARAGDTESASALLAMGRHLSSQLQTQAGGTLLGELVGIVTEKTFLNGLPLTAGLTAAGLTAEQRLLELQQRQAAIKEVASASDLLRHLGEREIITYMDRMKLHGEYAALVWLRNKYGEP